jgi:hypothetical protein
MPLAKLAVNNHDATSTRISLFLLTYSYHVHLVGLNDVEVPVREKISLI